MLVYVTHIFPVLDSARSNKEQESIRSQKEHESLSVFLSSHDDSYSDGRERNALYT